MSSPLDPTLRDQMRKEAQEIRERQAGASFTRGWSLTGKSAIVAPGKDVVVRLSPRWDYAQSVVLDPATNTRVQNLAYDRTRPQCVMTFEHWWEQDGGTPTMEYCPVHDTRKCSCPLGAASAANLASASKDDKEFGRRIKGRQVFLYNAAVGDPRLVGSDGLVDIRVLTVPGTVYTAIADIMTGGDKEQFARGDITHPREGYDLVLKRPVAGGGDRWSVQVAANPSPLYDAATQGAAFKGWVNRLTDLDEMLRKETKDAAGIFKAFYGRDPKPGEIAGDAPGVRESTASVSGVAQRIPPGPVEQQVAAFAEEAGSAAPPQGPDDEFLDLMPPAGGQKSPPPPSQRARR